MAWNVAGCDPVAVSPETWVRFCGMLPLKIAPKPPELPDELNPTSSTLATLRWLTFNPGNCPSADTSVRLTSVDV
jgi:hypothetical protein